MSEWQPIETVPVDCEVVLRWPDGVEAVAILMSPAPLKIDPEQRFFWGIDAMSYNDGRDWTEIRDEHNPDDATHWKARSFPESGIPC